MIPHLEPFGTHLAKRMHHNGDDSTRYCFQPLYDMTYQDAIQKFTQLNRYSFEGSYQGGGSNMNNPNGQNMGGAQSGAEIPLSGFNIQPNQVTIMANG
jgi:cell surface protein SprA